MKLHREAYTAADRKESGCGFCHRLKRQGSIARSTNSRVAVGEGDGSTANWVTWTRPLAQCDLYSSWQLDTCVGYSRGDGEIAGEEVAEQQQRL